MLLAGTACEVEDEQFLATTETPFATTPRPQPTATSVPQGFARSNPAPFGVSVVHNDMEVTVLDVMTLGELKMGSRKLPKELASPEIYEGIVGDPVDQDHTGLFVKVKLRNLIPKDESRRYSYTHFRLTGERGIIYKIEFSPTEGGYLGTGEFFGGATITGWILQQYHESDGKLVLIYSPLLAGSSYYSLEQSK